MYQLICFGLSSRSRARITPFRRQIMLHMRQSLLKLQSNLMEDAPAERNSVETKQARSEYSRWMSTTDIRCTLIFVDEAGNDTKVSVACPDRDLPSEFQLVHVEHTRSRPRRCSSRSTGCRHSKEEPKPHLDNLFRCWSGVQRTGCGDRGRNEIWPLP